MKCRECETVTSLHLTAITSCKRSINQITNQNPIYSHSYMRQLVSRLLGLGTELASHVINMTIGVRSGWIGDHIEKSSHTWQMLSDSYTWRNKWTGTKTEQMFAGLLTITEASHKEMKPRWLPSYSESTPAMKGCQPRQGPDWKKWVQEIIACQEVTEAYLGKMETSLDRKEPNLEANVETIRALDDWYMERGLAIGCYWQAKTRT
jgi:hypothetical protein